MGALRRGGWATGRPLLGDLDDARYAWTQVEAAYASSEPYAAMRSPLAD